jgi:hypothetical protein
MTRSPRIHSLALLALALSMLASTGRAYDADLRARAAEAFEAARTHTLKEPLDGRLDAVWHIDMLLQVRPDPQLEWWANLRRRLLTRHETYRLIEPTAPLALLPESPGTGIDKWRVYMRAPFGAPQRTAVRYVEEYLGPDLAAPESGYILTHQLTVLEWSKATELPLRAELWEREPVLLGRIAAEHAADDVFSDLFAERIFLLSVYGNPSDQELERSVRVIVDAQVEPGVWAPPPVTITYDGEAWDTPVEPEHARKMAMIALAEYLARTEADADAGAGAGADAHAGGGGSRGGDTGTADSSGAGSAQRDASALRGGALLAVLAGVGLLAALFIIVRRFRRR